MKKVNIIRKIGRKLDFMKDLKIGNKLIICFTSIGLSFLLAFGIALSGMVKSNKELRNMYDKNLIGVSTISNMSKLYQEEIVKLNSLFQFGPTTFTYKTINERRLACEAEIEESFIIYEKLMTDKKEEALFDTLQSFYHNEFQKTKEQFMYFAEAGRETDGRDSIVKYAKVIEDMAVKFRELTDYKLQLAEKSVLKLEDSFFILVNISLAFIILAIAYSLIMIRYLNKHISQKIVKIAGIAEELAVGNIDVEVEVESKDEVGQLANSFSKMIDGIKEQAKVALAIAEGNLSIEYAPKSEKNKLGNALVKTIDGLDSIFDTFRVAAGQVNLGANQVSSGAQQLSLGATEQASAVEELAATVEDISKQAKDNALGTSQVKDLVLKAIAEVKNGNEKMNRMIEAMEGIDSSSKKISKIIKVIDSIAFQTNILALNAAVEAARAGAAGKGFAVVAGEVRNLAGKSAEAAKDTTDLIQESINKVSEGTKIANSTADSLGAIVQSIDKIANIVEQIDISSDQQSVSITQVTQGIDQIATVVQTNSATAEESAAASEELSGQAQMLLELIAKIKLKEERKYEHKKDKGLHKEFNIELDEFNKY